MEATVCDNQACKKVHPGRYGTGLVEANQMINHQIVHLSFCDWKCLKAFDTDAYDWPKKRETKPRKKPAAV